MKSNIVVKEIDQTHALFKDYQYLRFFIFHQELKRVFTSFENVEDFKEEDIYDKFSEHFCLINKVNNEAMGVFRLIHQSSLGLSVKRRYEINQEVVELINSHDACEVSRFGVLSFYRGIVQADRLNVLGVYKQIFKYCHEKKMKYCFFAIEDRLSRMIRLHGFNIKKASIKEIKYNPPRSLYYMEITDSLFD